LLKLYPVNSFLYTEFIFSSGYRVWRHIAYWTFHILVWAVFWVIMGDPASFGNQLVNIAMWVPMYIGFGYPLIYIAIPYLLMKGRYLQFFLTMLGWGIAGLYIAEAYTRYVFIPLHHALGLDSILPRFLELYTSYLAMATAAASVMVIKLYKLWIIKQRAWTKMQREKLSAELELLKTQVHPHFLFNSLGSIYSFSMQGSSKTPGLILKLSSLLSYMLYDSKAEEVRLEKELEMMKNYVDLEEDRHGSKMEISWNMEGNAGGQMIAPLLLLPFFENAFKHGISKDIQQPWLAVDLMIQKNWLTCKIANSKSEDIDYQEDGAGISNVRKRLDFIYPGKYELKLDDGGYFFVATLQISLSSSLTTPVETQSSVSVVENTGTPEMVLNK
jgi:two-component system sensor histidine kinase AlgZ